MYTSETGSESSNDLENKETNLPLCQSNGNFKFPAAPRLIKSANNSLCSTASDSSNCEIHVNTNRSFVVSKKKKRKQVLPPLGIYWDIENCQVPKQRNAAAVVQKIREVFLEKHRESEFVVVCDIKKESPQIIQELHDSQVTLLHVSSLSKNAADEKLRQSLRRFGELHSPPATVLLISSDINFAADICDLRYRKKIKIILVHNKSVADALILCANEHHIFSDLLKDLPPVTTPRRKVANTFSPFYLTVSNLPMNYNHKRLKQRLRMLIDNSGGKILEISTEEGIASIRFRSFDSALRAQKRIQGEDVFGNKIKVLSPSVRHYTGRKVKSCELQLQPTLALPSDISSQKYAQDAYSRQPETRKQIQNPTMNDSYMFRPIRGMGAMNAPTPMDLSYDRNWTNQNLNGRRSLTPQELLNFGVNPHKHSGTVNFSDDGKVLYNSEGENNAAPTKPITLIISNLDSSLEIKELKKILLTMLEKYAMVLSLEVSVQSDGSPVAIVQVGNQQEAQFAISQLHRQKLGPKRIIISYMQNNAPDPEHLRAMVIEILQEVPDKCMPLFKFIDLLESRYHCTVSVSEVNKLKDICRITDEYGSRIISLTQELKTSPPPNLSKTFLPYCTIHTSNGIQSRGWCELNVIQAPNVMISLKRFTEKLISLLEIHMGCMPLLSFQICYEQEFQEPLLVDEAGVPLEHLISCVPNIEIKCVGPNKNIKVIKFSEAKNSGENEEETVMKSFPLPLAPNVNLLCRELVDLLKTTEKCQILLSKFIPAYHHHFGRQCRVADYGYTKLLDLFESIPHVAQIMGDGTRRVITLSHSAQIRRFTSDLLRVLKVQPSKQISITSFPMAYEKVMNKPFNPVEYGLCMFEDLLQEVPENTIVFIRNNEEVLIAIPKREQTNEEIIRTKQFAIEVINLLSHSPYYTMYFNKFVPAYHHHFGYQCKVSDYGFTKLIELFEAIPDVVKIEEMSDGERTVTLTLQQGLKVLGMQIVQTLKTSPKSYILLSDLPKLYLREYGYQLKPQLFECNSIREVVEKLSDYIQIIDSDAGPLLFVIDLDTIPNILKLRFWALLLKPPHCRDYSSVQCEYQSRYNSSFSMESLQMIKNVIQLSTTNDSNYISLTPLYVLAAQLYHVLYNNGGSVLFNNLEKAYQEMYGKPLKLSNYQIRSVDEFYNYFNLMFHIRENRKKSVIFLHRHLAEHCIPLPPSLNKSNQPSAQRQEVANLLPPPPPGMLQSAMKKVSPPKPDTPPSPDSVPWSPSSMANLNFSIPLPISHNPKLLENLFSLYSPARCLIPESKNPWKYCPPVAAPDPADLPMPDQLMPKYGTKDDYNDSGVNIKLENSQSDNENEGTSSKWPVFGGDKKSKVATSLNFSNLG